MAFLTHWIVTVLLLAPAAGLAAVATLGRAPAAARWVALSTMLLGLALSLVAMIPFRWRQAAASPQLITRAPLIGSIHLEYEAGIDGLSFPLIVLVTVLIPLLCLISWDSEARSLTWLAVLLGLEFLALGALVSLNLLLMCVFLAATLVGLMLILRQGGGDRAAAAGMCITLSIGLCFLLVCAIGAAQSGGTLDMAVPNRAKLIGPWCFAVVGFLFWMGIVPFHLWLVRVVSLGSAAAAVSVSALAPMLGGYGLFRVGGWLWPAAHGVWMAFAAVGIVSVLYAGLCALTRLNVERFVADAITLLMGFVLLGFSIRNTTADSGAMLLLLSEALTVALLVYDRAVASEESTGVSALAWIAWLVAPTALGQTAVVLGTFQAARAAPGAYGLGVAASAGAVLSAVAAARMFYRTRFPPSPEL